MCVRRQPSCFLSGLHATILETYASLVAAASTAASFTGSLRRQLAMSFSGSSQQHRDRARLLLAGVPSREEALKAQRHNLERFVQEHAAAFEALNFHPWTRTHSRFGVKVAISASTLSGCAGLRGVLLNEEVVTGSREKPLLNYPGLLLTQPLLQAFNALYYCPTALDLPSLQSCFNSGLITIVGDPTAAAAIINDGRRSGKERQYTCLQRTRSPLG